jgi:heme exporter protein D
MELGPHADFIIAAYIAAFVVVGGLIAWVVLDYRAQKGALADLDARGSSRRGRSATSSPANAERPA